MRAQIRAASFLPQVTYASQAAFHPRGFFKLRHSTTKERGGEMGSKKRSSWSKQKAEFNASLGGMDSLFASEGERQKNKRAEKEAALRKKACESKNRYTSKSEAEAAISECASYGTTGLHSYRCPYCDGWHLTSKPERNH